MSEVSEVLKIVDLPEDVRSYVSRFATFEEAWQECRRADWMLMMVEKFRRGSRQGLRLFACKCARRWWHFMNDVRSQRAVEGAEKLAAGQLSSAAVEFLKETAEKAAQECSDATKPIVARAAEIAVVTLHESPLEAAKAASEIAAVAEHAINDTMSDEHQLQILAEQAEYLRELLGNPFATPARAQAQG